MKHKHGNNTNASIYYRKSPSKTYSTTIHTGYSNKASPFSEEHYKEEVKKYIDEQKSSFGFVSITSVISSFIKEHEEYKSLRYKSVDEIRALQKHSNGSSTFKEQFRCFLKVCLNFEDEFKQNPKNKPTLTKIETMSSGNSDLIMETLLKDAIIPKGSEDLIYICMPRTKHKWEQTVDYLMKQSKPHDEDDNHMQQTPIYVSRRTVFETVEENYGYRSAEVKDDEIDTSGEVPTYYEYH